MTGLTLNQTVRLSTKTAQGASSFSIRVILCLGMSLFHFDFHESCLWSHQMSMCLELVVLMCRVKEACTRHAKGFRMYIEFIYFLCTCVYTTVVLWSRFPSAQSMKQCELLSYTCMWRILCLLSWRRRLKFKFIVVFHLSFN